MIYYICLSYGWYRTKFKEGAEQLYFLGLGRIGKVNALALPHPWILVTYRLYSTLRRSQFYYILIRYVCCSELIFQGVIETLFLFTYYAKRFFSPERLDVEFFPGESSACITKQSVNFLFLMSITSVKPKILYVYLKPSTNYKPWKSHSWACTLAFSEMTTK